MQSNARQHWEQPRDGDKVLELSGDRLRVTNDADGIPLQDKEDDLEGNVIQHDRGNHLVRTKPRLQHAWNESPEAADEHARREDDQHEERCRDAERPHEDCNNRGAESAKNELTLGAHVEDASPEGDRDRKASKDEWRCIHQRLSDRSKRSRNLLHAPRTKGGLNLCRVSKSSFNQREIRRDDAAHCNPSGSKRILPSRRNHLYVCQNDEDGSDRKGGSERKDWSAERSKNTQQARHQETPPIRRPMRSRVASAPSRMPIKRP